MLKIRPDQIRVFDDAARLRFEDEMVLHSKDFSPRLCEVIGDAQLRVALRQTFGRADSHGFTLRGPIRLCVEMMFLFGSGFDDDPQYPAVADILHSADDQMPRAERLFDWVMDYQERVSGENNANVQTALQALADFARGPMTIDPNEFETEMRRIFAKAFPQKVAFVGEAALSSLIQQSRAEADKHEFSSVRAWVLLAALMFAFGHRCTEDPLYPWIRQTLEDPRIIDSEERAKRLEKKALTWLDRVLARARSGEPT